MCFALPGVNMKVNEEKVKSISIAIDFLNQHKMKSVDKNVSTQAICILSTLIHILQIRLH